MDVGKAQKCAEKRQTIGGWVAVLLKEEANINHNLLLEGDEYSLEKN